MPASQTFNEFSEKGAIALTLEEGVVLEWYLDAGGYGTIGSGLTFMSEAFRKWWSANKPGIKFGKGATITRDEARAALLFCMREEYGRAVDRFYGKKVAQRVFDGTCSVAYNAGNGSLGWTWAKKLKAGDIEGGCTALLTTAITTTDKRTGKRRVLEGLKKRRAREARMIEKGEYYGTDFSPVAKRAIQPIDPLADGMLERGERGTAVAKLIRDLHELGYYNGALDDLFGYGTEAAVLAFQRDHKLDPDGIAGPVTLAKIVAEIRAKALQSDTPTPAEPLPPVEKAPKPAPDKTPKPEILGPGVDGAKWVAVFIIVVIAGIVHLAGGDPSGILNRLGE